MKNLLFIAILLLQFVTVSAQKKSNDNSLVFSDASMGSSYIINVKEIKENSTDSDNDDDNDEFGDKNIVLLYPEKYKAPEYNIMYKVKEMEFHDYSRYYIVQGIVHKKDKSESAFAYCVLLFPNNTYLVVGDEDLQEEVCEALKFKDDLINFRNKLSVVVNSVTSSKSIDYTSISCSVGDKFHAYAVSKKGRDWNIKFYGTFSSSMHRLYFKKMKFKDLDKMVTNVSRLFDEYTKVLNTGILRQK